VVRQSIVDETTQELSIALDSTQVSCVIFNVALPERAYLARAAQPPTHAAKLPATRAKIGDLRRPIADPPPTHRRPTADPPPTHRQRRAVDTRPRNASAVGGDVRMNALWSQLHRPILASRASQDPYETTILSLYAQQRVGCDIEPRR